MLFGSRKKRKAHGRGDSCSMYLSIYVNSSFSAIPPHLMYFQVHLFIAPLSLPLLSEMDSLSLVVSFLLSLKNYPFICFIIPPSYSSFCVLAHLMLSLLTHFPFSSYSLANDPNYHFHLKMQSLKNW